MSRFIRMRENVALAQLVVLLNCIIVAWPLQRRLPINDINATRAEDGDVQDSVRRHTLRLR